MNKKIIMGVLLSLCIMLIDTPCFAHETTEKSNEPIIECRKMTLTSYLPTGNATASGVMPYKGVAAAKREWLGKIAVVFERTEDDKSGELIGVYEILDTGQTNGLKNGYVIDIFCESREECLPTQKVYVYLMDKFESEDDDEEKDHN